MRLSALAAIMFLAVPGFAAQPDPWELTEVLEVSEAEFSFNYPKGYTLTESEGGYLIPPGFEPVRNATIWMDAPTPIKHAYVMTELQSDVAFAMDADHATLPIGKVIFLLSSPLADWRVDPLTSVYEASLSAADILGFSTFQRTPIAVMGKLGVICEGVNATLNKRSTILVVWKDDDYVFVLGIDTPGIRPIPEADDDLMALLGTFRGKTAAALDRDIALGTTGYIVSVPSAWRLQQSTSRFELLGPSDRTSDGMQLVFAQLSEYDMRANNSELETNDDAIGFILQAFDFIDPVYVEVMIAEAITLEISGVAQDENIYVRAAPFMLGEDMLAFIQFAEDAESLERFEQTFEIMLSTVRPAPDGED